jgi:hypothetical protein
MCLRSAQVRVSVKGKDDTGRRDCLEVKPDGVSVVVQPTFDSDSSRFRGLVWNSAKQKNEPFTRAAFCDALHAVQPGIEISDGYEPDVINGSKAIHCDRPERLKAAAASTIRVELGITTKPRSAA